MQLIQIEDIRPTSKPPRFALFELGFRPFYLGGAVFAALALPLWLAMWLGALDFMGLPPLWWHAHELVFGFAAAIVAGFLFTAVRNWTGLPMPAGGVLGSFVGLWLAGRIGLALGHNLAIALVDSAFLLVLAAALARKFLRAGNRRNWTLVAVLVALSTANLVFHAAALGRVDVDPLRAIEAGLMLVVVLESIIGGRVVPGFTANAIPGLRQFKRVWLDRLAIGGGVCAFALDIGGAPPALAAAVALLAAGLHGARLAGWNPWSTRHKPILWVLHLSYAWIPAGLALLGLAAYGVVPRSAAIHALAIGAMAGLIVGMITRTALGHTGRPLHAGRAEVAAYVLVHVAALLRVVAALVPAFYTSGLWLAGGAWTLAFAIYAVAYAPILARPRVDGRRG